MVTFIVPSGDGLLILHRAIQGFVLHRALRPQGSHIVYPMITVDPDLIATLPIGDVPAPFLEVRTLVLAFRFSDHAALAAGPQGPHPALLAPHAERREGLDHAGGDGAAPTSRISSISAKNDQKTPEFTLAQPQWQDPCDDRSRRAGRPADRPVRERRDPALSCRKDRPVPARRSGGALETHIVADVADGRRRADVRPGRLLPQVRRQGLSRTSGLAIAMSTRRSGFWACSTRGSPGANGSWDETTPSPTLRRSAGCAT